jgi:hypothetical protein
MLDRLSPYSYVDKNPKNLIARARRVVGRIGITRCLRKKIRAEESSYSNEYSMSRNSARWSLRKNGLAAIELLFMYGYIPFYIFFYFRGRVRMPTMPIHLSPHFCDAGTRRLVGVIF